MNDNRRKLTGILKLLYENTDNEHSMDTYQIMDALESMGYGRPDRKTIDANIKYMIEDMGFGIVKEKGKPNRYRWTNREFELSELKLIADALHSARFIPSKRSREIIAKLKDLTSIHQAAFLNREIASTNHYKRDCNFDLGNADILSESIKNHTRVSFQLASYGMSGAETLVEGGKTFEVSPYMLMWNNDCCYMLGKPSDSADVRPFRIAYIRDLRQLRVPSEHEPKSFFPENYTEHTFDMFSGTVRDVTLRCKSTVMGSLIDKFGRDFITEKIDQDHFNARVQTDINPKFFAWVFSHRGDMTIEEPSDVKTEFSNMLSAQL